MDFFGRGTETKYSRLHWTIRDDFRIWDVKREVLKPSYLRDLSFIVTLNPGRQCGYLFSTLNVRASGDIAVRIWLNVLLNGNPCLALSATPFDFDFNINNDYTYTAEINAASRSPSDDHLLHVFIIIGIAVTSVSREEFVDLEELSHDMEYMYRFDRNQVGRLTCSEGRVAVHPFVLLSRYTDFPMADFGIGSSVGFEMSLIYLKRFVRYLYTGRTDDLNDLNYAEVLRTTFTLRHLHECLLLLTEERVRSDLFPVHKLRKIVFLGFHDEVNVSHNIRDRRCKQVFGDDNFSFALEVLPGHTSGTWLKYTGTSSSNSVFNFEVEIGVIKDDTYTYVHGERHTLEYYGGQFSSTHFLFLGSRNVFGNLLIYGRLQLSITLKFRYKKIEVGDVEEIFETAGSLRSLSLLAQSFWEGFQDNITADLFIFPAQGDPIPCHKVMFRARLNDLDDFDPRDRLWTNEIEIIGTQLSSEHIMCILEFMYKAQISDDLRNHRYDEVRQFAIDNEIYGLQRFFQEH
ncbi:hypothetical protein CDAR_549351 [Caerostris darwini]|uniref:BTB domain-containing protein n=1 Tax=Caerostris darwini TaxID=1538125 RepID=A0AAV4XA48_9ARAC|nr:hypothetical protein CDAR_549351 [Caerostris darwini]